MKRYYNNLKRKLFCSILKNDSLIARVFCSWANLLVESRLSTSLAVVNAAVWLASLLKEFAWKAIETMTGLCDRGDSCRRPTCSIRWLCWSRFGRSTRCLSCKTRSSLSVRSRGSSQQRASRPWQTDCSDRGRTLGRHFRLPPHIFPICWEWAPAASRESSDLGDRSWPCWPTLVGRIRAPCRTRRFCSRACVLRGLAASDRFACFKASSKRCSLIKPYA